MLKPDVDKDSVRLPSGLVVPRKIAEESKSKIRWTRDEFKGVVRMVRFLNKQDIKLAMMCTKCDSPIEGRVETSDRVWECKCTIRRVALQGV